MSAPGYWMWETSGVLRPVISDYLNGKELDRNQIATMRAYLRQWIEASVWFPDDVAILRQRVNELFTRADIKSWLDDALAVGIDPL